MTRPSSDDEDDGDEKGEEEKGERIGKDEGLYKQSHGLREGQGAWGRSGPHRVHMDVYCSSTPWGSHISTSDILSCPSRPRG